MPADHAMTGASCAPGRTWYSPGTAGVSPAPAPSRSTAGRVSANRGGPVASTAYRSGVGLHRNGLQARLVPPGVTGRRGLRRSQWGTAWLPVQPRFGRRWGAGGLPLIPQPPGKEAGKDARGPRHDPLDAFAAVLRPSWLPTRVTGRRGRRRSQWCIAALPEPFGWARRRGTAPISRIPREEAGEDACGRRHVPGAASRPCAPSGSAGRARHRAPNASE